MEACPNCDNDYYLRVIDALAHEQISAQIKDARNELLELAKEIDLENSRKSNIKPEPARSEEKPKEEKPKIIGTILESRLRKN